MKKSILLTNTGQEFFFDNENTLLDVLLKNKIPVDHSCDGNGTCGTCRIFVKSNLCDLHDRNEIEKERALDLNLKPDQRLSSQLPPIHNLKIRIPD